MKYDNMNSTLSIKTDSSKGYLSIIDCTKEMEKEIYSTNDFTTTSLFMNKDNKDALNDTNLNWYIDLNGNNVILYVHDKESLIKHADKMMINSSSSMIDLKKIANMM